MTNAGYLAIEIDQSTDFELDFQITDTDNNPVSMSGATVGGKIRQNPQAVDPPTATFVGTVTDGPNGKGKVTLSHTVTAAITVNNSPIGQRRLTPFVYDITVTFADGTVNRVLEGLCLVSPAVAR